MPTIQKTVFFPPLGKTIAARLISPDIILASFPSTRTSSVHPDSHMIRTRLVVGKRTYTYHGPVTVNATSGSRTVLSAKVSELHGRSDLSVRLVVAVEPHPPRGTEVIDANLTFHVTGSITAIRDDIVEHMAARILSKFCSNLEKNAMRQLEESGLAPPPPAPMYSVPHESLKEALAPHRTNARTPGPPTALSDSGENLTRKSGLQELTAAAAAGKSTKRVSGRVKKIDHPILARTAQRHATPQQPLRQLLLLTTVIGLGTVAGLLLLPRAGSPKQN